MKDRSLKAIAQYLGAELRGDGDLRISGINTLQDAREGQIAFLANPAYKKYLSSTTASAVILGADSASDFDGNALIVANPYAAYASLSALFVETGADPAPTIHPSAVIAGDVRLGENVSIGPHAVVEAGTRIGNNASIGAGSYIGGNTRLGNNVKLFPNVVIYHGVEIGSDCIFHGGVIIGADGFGFARDDREWVKIHQLGGVKIGNAVEIGAGSCVDRGALNDTEIEDGVKIDNLVQIGHNCIIGRNTVICGCTAIAGSVEVGANCTIGGAVGIVGHLKIVDGVTITAMTLVTKSITKPGSYSSGTTCVETSRWRKTAVRYGQLEELNSRVRFLEKQSRNANGED